MVVEGDDDDDDDECSSLMLTSQPLTHPRPRGSHHRVPASRKENDPPGANRMKNVFVVRPRKVRTGGGRQRSPGEVKMPNLLAGCLPVKTVLYWVERDVYGWKETEQKGRSDLEPSTALSFEGSRVRLLLAQRIPVLVSSRHL